LDDRWHLDAMYRKWTRFFPPRDDLPDIDFIISQPQSLAISIVSSFRPIRSAQCFFSASSKRSRIRGLPVLAKVATSSFEAES
jgi:hypothetical protein